MLSAEGARWALPPGRSSARPRSENAGQEKFCGGSLPEPSFEDRRVGVGAAVAQEGPVAADFLHAAQIAFDDEDLFFVGGSFRDQLARRDRRQTTSPRIPGRCRAGPRSPRGSPRPRKFRWRWRASAGWCARRRAARRRTPPFRWDASRWPWGKREYSRRAGWTSRAPSGIPLVPADQHADAAVARVEIGEAQIARREIELLVVERIVGDVHLAVDAQQRAVGVEHGGRVVIQPGGAALEERRDDDHVELGAPACPALR